jgi:hypothetical protein
MIKENKIENDFIKKLQDLKYKYRPDIRDKKSLELKTLQISPRRAMQQIISTT